MNGNKLPKLPQKKTLKEKQKEHDAHDDCFCSEPITAEEATNDEDLPASAGGVEGDA